MVSESVAQTAFAANVKVTPLGGITGEFCRLDRAMIFEDPDGTGTSAPSARLFMA